MIQLKSSLHNKTVFPYPKKVIKKAWLIGCIGLALNLVSGIYLSTTGKDPFWKDLQGAINKKSIYLDKTGDPLASHQQREMLTLIQDSINTERPLYKYSKAGERIILFYAKTTDEPSLDSTPIWVKPQGGNNFLIGDSHSSFPYQLR